MSREVADGFLVPPAALLLRGMAQQQFERAVGFRERFRMVKALTIRRDEHRLNAQIAAHHGAKILGVPLIPETSLTNMSTLSEQAIPAPNAHSCGTNT